MSNHTPGPWVVVENPDAKNGSNAASIYSDKTDMYIADVYRGYVGCEHMKANEQLSNALLIATAPELLEALRAMLAASLPVDKDANGMDAVEKAISAINKARGMPDKTDKS